MSKMRCLTISEAERDGADDAEPLLVVQVDGPMIRRVMALIVDYLAADPAPCSLVAPRRPPPPPREDDRDEGDDA